MNEFKGYNIITHTDCNFICISDHMEMDYKIVTLVVFRPTDNTGDSYRDCSNNCIMVIGDYRN